MAKRTKDLILDWMIVILETLPRGREPSPDDERKHATDQLSPWRPKADSAFRRSVE
jgi:hypothetical protein